MHLLALILFRHQQPSSALIVHRDQGKEKLG